MPHLSSSIWRPLVRFLWCLGACSLTGGIEDLKLEAGLAGEFLPILRLNEAGHPVIRRDDGEEGILGNGRIRLVGNVKPGTDVGMGIQDFQLLRNNVAPGRERDGSPVQSYTVSISADALDLHRAWTEVDDSSLVRWFIAWWRSDCEEWSEIREFRHDIDDRQANLIMEIPRDAVRGFPVLLRWRTDHFDSPNPEKIPDAEALSRLQEGQAPNENDLPLFEDGEGIRAPLLGLAASWGSEPWVRYWIDHHQGKLPRFSRNADPLLLAAQHNHAGVVEALIEAGFDPDRSDSWGFDAGHFAAFYGHQEVMRVLLAHGYSVRSRVGDGSYDPISLAMDSDYDDIFGILREAGARFRDFNRSKKDPLLIWHALEGHEQIVRFLLEEKGADPNAESNGAITVLALACKGGNLAVVDALIEAGANPDGNEVAPPLLVALGEGHTAIARRLLDSGADPNVVDKNGVGSLPLAIYQRDREILAELLASGANPAGAALPESSLGLLEMATLAGERDIVGDLFAAGVSCRFRPDEAEEILLAALRSDIPEMADAASESCVDPDFKFYGTYDFRWVTELYDAKETLGWIEHIRPSGAIPPPNLYSASEVDSRPKVVSVHLPKFGEAEFDRYGEIDVKIRALIDEEGIARFPRLSGDALPSQLAIPLLRMIPEWKFQPALREGKPVKTSVVVPLKFSYLPPPSEIFEANQIDRLPKLVHRVDPSHPRFPSGRGLDGQATLILQIDADGSVSDVEVLASSHPLLKFAAINAVRQWRFTPPTIQGKPVKARFLQRITFAR